MKELILANLPVIYCSNDKPLTFTWRSPRFSLVELLHKSTILSVNEYDVEGLGQEIVLIAADMEVKVKGNLDSVRVMQFESSFLSALLASGTPYMRLALNNHARRMEWKSFWSFQPDEGDLAQLIRISVRLFRFLTDLLVQIYARESELKPAELLPHFSIKDSRMIDAALYIKAQIANPDLSLPMIARAIGYHPNYFCRQFKQVMQISPMKYVAQARIEKALDLLRTTDATIEDICVQTGIAKSSSLSAMVKNLVGLTPSEYRRVYRLSYKRPKVAAAR